MSDALPRFPAGLTADWLTELLHSIGAAPANSRIASATQSQVGEGVGAMSELVRVHLEWSTPNDALPRTLIAKYPSPIAPNRAAAREFNLYRREVRYFLELDARTTARSARCYFGEVEDDNFLLLLEDLGDYRVGRQELGAGLADTTRTIDELARLHAPFWNNPDGLDWVPHVSNSFHATALEAMSRGAWDNMIAVFGAHIPAAIQASRDRFFAAIPRLQQAMDTAPTTFVHGDLRMDNLLFAERPEHAEIVIIDWQGPLLAKGVVDVALLLGQNTLIDVRREHERVLIQRYVDGLAALGVVYPFDAAWDDYRTAILYHWLYASAVTGGLDSSNPRASSWMTQCVMRQCAATIDHNLLALL